MKQAAEAMGIDTENPELTEEEKKYNREHDLEVDTKQFERHVKMSQLKDLVI